MSNIDSGMSFGYTGKIFDSDTGLYDYGFRDYSPNSARFTTVDPVRDGNNWFSYVVNDPVNYIDPFGLTPSDAGNGNSPKITFTSDIIQQTYIGDTQFNFSIDVSKMGSGSVASSNVTFSFGSTSQSSSNQSSFSKVTNGAIGVIIDAITPSPVKEFIGWVYENRSAIADTVWGGAEIVIGRTLDLGSGPLGMLAGAGSIFWTDGAALTYAPAIAISVAGASKATGLALTKQGKARYEKGSSSFTPRKSSGGNSASEQTAKKMAKQIEKDLGKDARRNFHDAKEPGEPDRTIEQLRQDASQLYREYGKEPPKWMSDGM